MMKFRLLSGIHSHGGVTYVAGDEDHDVVESEIDLERRFNSPGSIKFQRIREEDCRVSAAVLDDKGPSETRRVSLESLTVNQLRKLAEEREVDLGDAIRKDEIIGALRSEGVEP